MAAGLVLPATGLLTAAEPSPSIPSAPVTSIAATVAEEVAARAGNAVELYQYIKE